MSSDFTISDPEIKTSGLRKHSRNLSWTSRRSCFSDTVGANHRSSAFLPEEHFVLWTLQHFVLWTMWRGGAHERSTWWSSLRSCAWEFKARVSKQTLDADVGKWQKCEIRIAVIFICFFYLKQKERQVCWLSCSWVKSADQLSRWQGWRRQNLVKGRLCPALDMGMPMLLSVMWEEGGWVVTMLGQSCVLLLLFDKQKLVTHEKPIDS